MKFNFKKITSVIACTALLGSTLGFAAAVNYPEPFVTGGAADVAIVYGSNPLTAVTDSADAALTIGASLSKSVASTGAITLGEGDKYRIERGSTQLHVGSGFLDVLTTGKVDENKLPTILSEGQFTDKNNDLFDYSQQIQLSNVTLTMFKDSDYKKDEPVVGYKIDKDTNVLNYTLTMDDEPLWANLETKDLPLMGKNYYILDAVNNTSLTLLDSAGDGIVADDDVSTTVNAGGKTYVVTAEYIGATSVKLNIDGKLTNVLSVAQTQRLDDGSYVGIREILYNSKESRSSSVEFSIGTGKLKLTDGDNVELNEDESVDGLKVDLVSSGEKLKSVNLIWTNDKEAFVTEDKTLTMPGFESLTLSYTGMTVTADGTKEAISIEPDGKDQMTLNNFPMETSDVTFSLLYGNTTYGWLGLGEDSETSLKTVASGALTFNGNTDAYFVVSYVNGDEAQSYLVKFDSFKETNNGADNETSMSYMKDGAWEATTVGVDDTPTFGNSNIDLTIGTIDADAETVVVTPGTNINFKEAYSKGGLKVNLPVIGSGAGSSINLTLVGPANHNRTSYNLLMEEEDKDNNKGSGSDITATLGFNSDGEASVKAVSGGGATSEEIQSTNVYRNFVYSAHGTEILFDQSDESSAQDSLILNYPTEEYVANVYLSASAAVTSEAGTVLTIMDSEVASIGSQNLIVVGGSCINTVAAELLGGTLCGTDFSAKANNVGAGMFLIKTFDRPGVAGKVATLVAGYDALDTVNAANALTTKTVEIAVGKAYTGTTAETLTAA